MFNDDDRTEAGVVGLTRRNGTEAHCARTTGVIGRWWQIRFAFLLVSVAALAWQCRADALSSAFSQASSMARSFSLSGMGSAPVFSTSWSPSLSSTSAEPPSATQLTVKSEIAKREKLIGSLTGTREIWRVALEKLERGQNW